MKNRFYKCSRWALALLVALVATSGGAWSLPLPAAATLSPDLTFLVKRLTSQPFSEALAALPGISLEPATPQISVRQPKVGVLVRTTSVAALRARGVHLNSVVGDVVSAKLTLSQLQALRSWPEVIYAEGPRPLGLSGEPFKVVPAPELTDSLAETNAQTLHNQGITGKGVVVGVVDTGVDWTHLDFRSDRNGDGFEESTRILSIWDQTHPGKRPAGFDYGAEYTQKDIANALKQGDDNLIEHFDGNPNAPSHGTHALGIIGSDGSSSKFELVGMAPEASLVAVKSPLTPDSVVDGVQHIFNVAGSQPAVASLSLGSHLGAHDGTSNFERALDALAQQPGRVIVAAAGNEGDDRIHVGGQLAATAKVSMAFVLPSPLQASRFSFDFWYESDPDINVRITVTGPSGETLGPVSTGELLDTSFVDGGVFVSNADQGPNPNNGMNEALVTVYGDLFGALNPLRPGRWTLTLEAWGLGTRYDGWALDRPFTSANADSQYTIRIPATAPHIIAVGAYVTRTEWPSINGAIEHFEIDGPLGHLAKFSSLGPTRDGRIKPDLVAPGSMVASALSKFSTTLVEFSRVLSDGVHLVNRGTSFAAPHVSGAAALLLQTDPTLTGVQVQQHLEQTALHDGFTGPFASTRWGHGKLDLVGQAIDPNLTLVTTLDRNQDDVLGDVEILNAIQLWISGDTLAGSTDTQITDQQILWLITLWIEQVDLGALNERRESFPSE